MANNLPPEIMKQFKPQAGLQQSPIPMPSAPASRMPTAGPILDQLGRSPEEILQTQSMIARTSPVPSASRIDQFFGETLPSAAEGVRGIFSGLDEGAEAYGQRAQARRDVHAAGATEVARGIGVMSDVRAPSLGEAFEAAPQHILPATQVPDPYGRSPEKVKELKDRIAATAQPVEGPNIFQSAMQGLAESPFVNPQTNSGGFAGIEEGLAEAVGQQPQVEEGLAEAVGQQPQVAEPSLFRTPAPVPLPSAEVGQVAAPTPFDQPEATNPLLAPQVQQEYAPQQPEANIGTPFSAMPQAPAQPQAEATQPQGLTTLSGMPLNEFLAGGAAPEAGLMRAENPMYGANSQSRGLTGAPAAQAMEAAGQAAGTRPMADGTFAPPQNTGGPDSMDREAGELSMADAVSLSGGDRDAARAMVVASRQGGGTTLTPEQQVARERLELDRAKFADTVINREGPQKELTAAQKEFAKKSGEGAYDWDQGGRASAQENIDKFDGVINDLKTGQLDTRTLVEFAPFVGDWARSAVNPTGQQGLDTIRGVIFQGLRDTLGAQFTEREGERLVNAAYNPKLDEASNIARLEPALARMRATFDAKESLTQHIIGGGSVKDYQGQTPREVYDSFDGGGGGSPIQGDVDVQTAADDILNSL